MQDSENSYTPNKEINTSAMLNTGMQKCNQSLWLQIKFLFRRDLLCRPGYPEFTMQTRLVSNLTLILQSEIIKQAPLYMDFRAVSDS